MTVYSFKMRSKLIYNRRKLLVAHKYSEIIIRSIVFKKTVPYGGAATKADIYLEFAMLNSLSNI